MAEFVYIVESPSDDDLYEQRNESSLLTQAAGLNNLSCVARMSVSRDAFERAISQGLRQAIDTHFPQDPILHISVHGSEEGIKLTNGDFLSWNDLKELLVPISRYRKWGLLLCMSSCEGIHARRMALLEQGEEYDPFYAIVGNSGKPTWSETAVAYASFYHFLARGSMLSDAVEAMKAASGNTDFQILTALEEKKEKWSRPRPGDDGTKVGGVNP